MFFVKKQGWCPNYIVKSLYFSINIIDTKITKLTWRGGVPIILSNHFSILILKYRNLYGRWWYCIFCKNILVTIGVTYFSIAPPCYKPIFVVTRSEYILSSVTNTTGFNHILQIIKENSINLVMSYKCASN